MPRIKSAIKRVDVARRNRERNVAYKSACRTAIKKVLELVAKKADQAELAVQLSSAFSILDRAVLKGIFHKNTVARYKSRLARSIQAAV